MMKATKPVDWTRRTVVVALASSLIGFWLPNGLALLARLAGRSVHVDLATNVAAAAVGVAFSLVLEQAHMINQNLTQQREDIVQILTHDIAGHLSEGIKDILASAQLIAQGSNVRSEAVRSLLLDLSSVLQPIAGLPEPLRSGVATWMRSQLADYRAAMSALLTRGVPASLSEHVAVTRALLDAGASKYLQINLHAFDANNEWSRDWKDLLTDLKRDGKGIEYIVLASQDYIEANDGRLRSMRDYLKTCDGILRVCDTALVNDSLGNIEIATNLELFDESVVKTQSPSPSGYRGGITLTMSLAQADDRPDLIRLIRAIQGAAKAYK